MAGEDQDLWKTKTLRPAEPIAPATTAPRFYLLVVHRESSSIFHLPTTGVIRLGRDPDADLPLGDETASRNHAKIITADGNARLQDLGSHNGTFVNGERVDTRVLLSGDVITIGEMTLVLHAERQQTETHALVDAATLRRRLAEEVERAVRSQRTLVVLTLTAPSADARDDLGTAVGRELRLTDVIGAVGDTQLVVVLPELGSDHRALADAIAAGHPDARVGIAVCPDDACDADTLLAAARAAAAVAPSGRAAAAPAAARELRLGDRVIVVADAAMLRLFDLIARLAASELPILILGETGVGKEGAAHAVHEGSRRRGGPFVTLNCAAIPEPLVESELFGYEKGAFTGAVAAKPGKLEAAHGGTLFLDEIGELPSTVQSKLLRAIEQKRVTRLGEVKEREVDLRIVAATNRSLDDEVKAGRFRQDLFFRLGAATVVLPPLRDRPREVPMLARRFLSDACARAGREPPELSPATLQRLAAYGWPGNVRELRNAIEYAAATVDDVMVEPWHLPDKIAGVEEPAGAEGEAAPSTVKRFRPVAEELRELERKRMIEALEAADGVQRRAADLISMPLRTFVMKLKQYGITPRPRRET